MKRERKEISEARGQEEEAEERMGGWKRKQLIHSEGRKGWKTDTGKDTGWRRRNKERGRWEDSEEGVGRKSDVIRETKARIKV